jgi:hypothetical protein
VSCQNIREYWLSFEKSRLADKITDAGGGEQVEKSKGQIAEFHSAD